MDLYFTITNNIKRQDRSEHTESPSRTTEMYMPNRLHVFVTDANELIAELSSEDLQTPRSVLHDDNGNL